MRTRHLVGLVTSLFAAFSTVGPLALSSSGCGGGDSGSGDPGVSDAGPDSTSGETDPGTDTGGSFEVGGGCATAEDCDGGVCVGGTCCPSADRVCGDACCSSGDKCLFGKCVTPGAPCFTSNECKSGEYCETALGAKPGTGGDAGTDAAPSDAAGDGGAPSTCTEPPPVPGRCVKRPPVCADPVGDAGADTGSDECVPKCEYKPTTGALDAVPEWTWGRGAKEFANFIDVWSTPTVGRIHDTNCDGKVDVLDPPSVVFVSGDAQNTCCSCNTTGPSTCLTGVLRMLNGRTGKEVWSLRKASTASIGFAGTSTAMGDIDGDGKMEIVAVTGERFVVIVDSNGKVVMTSDKPIPIGAGVGNFGWGGGLALGDMDGDGAPEIAYGSTVFTTKGGALKLLFGGAATNDGREVAALVDVNGDGKLELLTGNTAVDVTGKAIWTAAGVSATAFPAVADLDRDGQPEVVIVDQGKMSVVDGKTGAVRFAATDIPGTGQGGPPTIADFDGDKFPEIGVAMQNFYTTFKPNYAKKTLDVLWSSPNHDLSSSVTGSSVFDFEGDGRAEVIYNDECFLWVYDGPTGKIRFVGLTTSFTATEASVVADVDGDGRSEILMIANRADPSSTGWKCNMAPWNAPDPATGRPAWKPPTGAGAYAGITAFGSASNSWVGTRTLWNEHTYHVTNVCDDRDSACDPPNVYGSIPKSEKKNWTLGWLNNFRQNVQDKGLFDAPDATVSLAVRCSTPTVLEASLRNSGLASLPAGVEVGLYNVTAGDKLLGKVTSTGLLFPGQTEVFTFTVPDGAGTKSDTYRAKVEIDPAKPLFRQCRADNDTAESKAACPK